MGSPDLSPLERAAAGAGHPGLRARVVAADARRDRWFALRPGELLVSEKVLDRLPPPDACALLVNQLVRRARLRRLAPWGFALLAVATASGGALFVALDGGLPGALAGLVPLLAAAVFALTRRQQAVLDADDETVARLGDATDLVRALNTMNQDEVRIGSRRFSAHPDLYPRAERLARKFRLCEAPRAP